MVGEVVAWSVVMSEELTTTPKVEQWRKKKTGRLLDSPKIFAPARKLAVSSGQFKFSTKILAGMVRWSEPVRMVLGNIRESPTNQNRARDFN